MSDFQVTTTVRARSAHTCCECSRQITAGESYERCAGRWDGEMDAFKTCAECAMARNWAIQQPEWAGDNGFLFAFGGLSEGLFYLMPEIPLGDGRRFKAGRLQVELSARAPAARQSKAA